MSKIMLISDETLETTAVHCNGMVEIKFQKWNPDNFKGVLLAWATLHVSEAVALADALSDAVSEAINFNAAKAGF